MQERVKAVFRGTILYVGNFVLPDRGASANRVVSNGKLFRMLGFRTVFLGVTDDEWFEGIRAVSSDVRSGPYPDMYEECRPKGSAQWFRHMVSLRNIRRMLAMYPDLKMIVLYNVPYSLLYRAKRAFPQLRVVYDCTEWTDTTDGSFLKRAVKKADEHFIRTRIDRTADGLIVVSSLMYRSYQNDNMLLLPPLVDAEDPIWRQSRRKESGSFEFCFAGLPDANKDGLELMLRAFAGLDEENAVLRLVGVEKSELLAVCPKEEALLRRLEARLLFMGRRSHAETLAYVQNADCNLIIREADRRNNAGFPTKFAEAYTTGKALITTDISDVSRYAPQAENVYMTAYDEKAVLKAMETALRGSGGTGLRQDFHYAAFAPACDLWLSRLLLEKA